MVINITKAPLAPPALQGNNSMPTALILGMFLTFLAVPAMAQGQQTFAVNGTVHTFQGSSWFPLHICGVKPTVSEELPFNQQVCGGEAKHTLHTCETPR